MARFGFVIAGAGTEAKRAIPLDGEGNVARPKPARLVVGDWDEACGKIGAVIGEDGEAAVLDRLSETEALLTIGATEIMLTAHLRKEIGVPLPEPPPPIDLRISLLDAPDESLAPLATVLAGEAAHTRWRGDARTAILFLRGLWDIDHLQAHACELCRCGIMPKHYHHAIPAEPEARHAHAECVTRLIARLFEPMGQAERAAAAAVTADVTKASRT